MKKSQKTLEVVFISKKGSKGLDLIRSFMKNKTSSYKKSRFEPKSDVRYLYVPWGVNYSGTTGSQRIRNTAVEWSRKDIFLKCVNSYFRLTTLNNLEDVTDALMSNQKVVARHLLNSSSGRGIEIFGCSEISAIPPAPLYTLYFPKTEEYRVHVFSMEGVVMTVSSKKVLPLGTKISEATFKIRTSRNGWVYVSKKKVPVEVTREIKRVVRNLKDTFIGAFDVLVNKEGVFRLLEVNAAPGVSPQIAKWYASHFDVVVDYCNYLDTAKESKLSFREFFKAATNDEPT